MKPFLDIGKYQREIILAVILACNYYRYTATIRIRII